MSDTKTFSALPVATALTGDEIVPIVQDHANKRTTIAQISEFFPAVDEAFIVASSAAGLPNERVLTADSGVTTITDNGAGSSIVVGLASTITAAGPVGDATHVPQITFDAKGRLTTVSSVAISASGNVNSGTSGQLTYYASTGATVSGNANANISNGALTLGVAASTIGQLILAGNTSGSATITPQATSGSPTITLPNASGTLAVSASSPLSLNSTTGALSITGAALTRTDDTNVTLTLGGSPTSALVNAASITAGWTGTLSGARGGTGTANTGKTITLGGSLTTSGSFDSTFTMTGSTSVTFPTSGTLATTGGASIPSVVQGDLLYGSASNVLSALAKDTNATRYLSNTGSSNNPAWAQIALTTGVSGVLPVANGGTNASSASITAFNNITGYTASGATGTTSTNLVFSTSPTLVTPTLGVASATRLLLPASQAYSTTIDSKLFGSGNLSGTVTVGSPIAVYQLAVDTDTVDASAVSGFNYLAGGGSIYGGAKGNRNGVFGTVNVAAATGNVAADDRYYVALAGNAIGSANDNGTGVTPSGNLFGFGVAARLAAAATFYNDLVGGEIDVIAETGSGVAYKAGLQIVSDVNDAVQGSLSDYGLGFGTAAGSIGFKKLISMCGAASAKWPLSSGGTLIGTETPATGTMTALYGVDFSAISFSGSGAAAFKSSGFLVDPDGDTTVKTLILNGSTSGTTTVKAAATAGTTTITLPAGTTDFSATGGTAQVVKQTSSGGAFTVATVAASEIASGAALTKSDDTNVTLTLGGTPTTALLAATSITAGWTGTLGPARGGTGVANNAASTLTISGSFATTLTVTGITGVTLPTTGTLATLAGSEALTNKSYNGLTLTSTTGTLTISNGKTVSHSAGTTFAGTDGKTLTISNSGTLSGGDAFVLSIAASKTLTCSNTLTFTGTDSSSVAFGAGGTVLYSGGALGTPSSGTLTSCTGLPLTTGITGTLGAANGGTGVANNASSTITISGNFGTTVTVSGTTSVTLPTSGTLSTLAGSEELTNKTLNASVGKGTWTASGTWTLPAITLGGTVSGGGNQLNNIIIGTSTPLAGTFTTLGSGAHTITSASATALAVGLNGATNPALLVDASTASSATGIKIKSAAAAGGVAVSVITSGTNENLTIDAAGSGTITVGGTSTGAITLTRATTMSAALTYGGVALSNAVTGTGNMVLATSPSFTTPVLGTPSSGNLSNCTAYPGTSALVTTGALASGSIANGFGTIATANTINSTGTTDATSTTTGMILTAGGISAQKGLWGKNLGLTTGADAAFIIKQWADASNYTCLSFNNDNTGTGMVGLVAGGTGNLHLYHLVPTGYACKFRVNNVDVGSLGTGIVWGSATGGDKGAGTANFAADIYKNNTAYTNPDFVFEHAFTGKIEKYADRDRAKDYMGLMPLGELLDYTQKNMRLPRISDEPAGMFERGDIVLEKLEEAYLYIMQLHERISALETREQ